jgi:hypothetical protein
MGGSSERPRRRRWTGGVTHLGEQSRLRTLSEMREGGPAYDAEAGRVCFFSLERVRFRRSGWGGSAATFPFIAFV